MSRNAKDVVASRECHKCKKSLPLDEFEKKKNGELYSTCKVCRPKNNAQSRNSYRRKVFTNEPKTIVMLPEIEMEVKERNNSFFDEETDSWNSYKQYFTTCDNRRINELSKDHLEIKKVDCVLYPVKITSELDTDRYELYRIGVAFFDFQNVRSIIISGQQFPPEIFTFTNPLIIAFFPYQRIDVEVRDKEKPVRLTIADTDWINNPFFVASEEIKEFECEYYRCAGGFLGIPLNEMVQASRLQVKMMDRFLNYKESLKKGEEEYGKKCFFCEREYE